MSRTNQLLAKRNRVREKPIFEQLEDVILDNTGLYVKVKCEDGVCKIKTDNFTDYLLAKSAIRGRISLEIQRA